MQALRVKKIVAGCFLEAVKLTLDHLGAHRMTAAAGGDAAGGSRIYADLRRLRAYVQARVSAGREVVELELDEDGRRLLVASCRRLVDELDLRIHSQPDDRERRFAQERREVVLGWAVALAEAPLLELPMPALVRQRGEGGAELETRLRRKLRLDTGQPAARKMSMISAGKVSPFGTGVAPPRHGADGAPPGLVPDDAALPSGMEARREELPVLLQGSALQDPRLRALVTMDLRSFERALESDDHRMATVLLVSVLESALLDYAIPRSAELGLEGSPETWPLPEVLLGIVGESLSKSDHAVARYLFRARQMLVPASQILQPTVATSVSLRRAQELVEEVLYLLGYRTQSTRLSETT